MTSALILKKYNDVMLWQLHVRARMLARPPKLNRYQCNDGRHTCGNTVNCKGPVNDRRRARDQCVQEHLTPRRARDRLWAQPRTSPKTKVCLTHGGRAHDELSEGPFMNSCGGSVMAVVFIQTIDPYFYDLCDRRCRPRKPPLELECASAVAPLRLPLSIAFG